MNPWLPHPGVPVDQADPASYTAASVSSQSGSDDTVPDLTEADVRESLGLVQPLSQSEFTNARLDDINMRVAAWRRMVLTDERTPMADRVETVLRDEKTLRDSVVKERIAEAMETILTPLTRTPIVGFEVSNPKMSKDGQTFTCDVSVPFPADYIRFDLKL
jgi:hypothetical protein